MNFPGLLSPDSTLPNYSFSRSLGLQTGADIDFKKLAEKLDCTRNFYHVGIIFDDGKQRWLVRPSRRIANANQSTVSHVVISKVPELKQPVAEKAIVSTLATPSLATEITSTGFACGAMLVTLIMAFGAGAAVPFTAGGSWGDRRDKLIRHVGYWRAMYDWCRKTTSSTQRARLRCCLAGQPGMVRSHHNSTRCDFAGCSWNCTEKHCRNLQADEGGILK